VGIQTLSVYVVGIQTLSVYVVGIQTLWVYVVGIQTLSVSHMPENIKHLEFIWINLNMEQCVCALDRKCTDIGLFD
jgi:hypothetical protein